MNTALQSKKFFSCKNIEMTVMKCIQNLSKHASES